MATINAVGNGLSGSTGSGSFVGSNSPTLVTPTLGAASATSINFGGSTLSAYTSKTAFTPTFSFATPGDLSVSYSTQGGNYFYVGNLCFVSYILVCTPTFTTSSGAAQFGGLPSTANTALYLTVGNKSSNITYPAGCSQIVASITSPNSFFTLVGFGTATGQTSLTTSNFTSGASFTIGVSGVYMY